jgi:hypothetical protein
MKLSEKSPYRGLNERKLFLKKHPLSCLNPLFLYKSGWKNHFQSLNLRKGLRKKGQNEGNDAKITEILLQSSSICGEMLE